MLVVRKGDLMGAVGTKTELDELFVILGTADVRGYIGEPVSQLEHAMQCAHFMRLSGGSDVEITAALLHDIGHLLPDSAPEMGELGVRNHERQGAAYLESSGFPVAVTALVAGHVDAKRYLAATDPRYAAELSQASQNTLVWQGGLMEAEECDRFARYENFESLLLLRRCDEAAKVPGFDCGVLATYRPLLERLLADSPWNAIGAGLAALAMAL